MEEGRLSDSVPQRRYTLYNVVTARCSYNHAGKVHDEDVIHTAGAVQSSWLRLPPENGRRDGDPAVPEELLIGRQQTNRRLKPCNVALNTRGGATG